MYPVFTYYSFDPNMPLHIFDTEKEAFEFIKTGFENEIVAARENGIPVVFSQHDANYSWAMIQYEDKDFIEWGIATIHDMRKKMK